jgi:hypothetical protein
MPEHSIAIDHARPPVVGELYVVRGYGSMAYIGSTPRVIKWVFVTFAVAICDVFHIEVRVVTKLEYAWCIPFQRCNKTRLWAHGACACADALVRPWSHLRQ